MANEFGDFQTPPELVDQVIRCLWSNGKVWTRVLEPTCGVGNFIRGVLDSPRLPEEVLAFELQNGYAGAARLLVAETPSPRVIIQEANVFDIDFGKDLRWEKKGALLVLGNPPWVTNSMLGSLRSDNVPRKTNLKGLRGMDARTGESNFDIAEYIWLKLIRELEKESPCIALLCKTSVARNVLKFCYDSQLPIANSFIRKIDAQRWFGASVDACLFGVEVGVAAACYETRVYEDLIAQEPTSVIGFARKQIVADMQAYNRSGFLDGVCPFNWRQGVKHDAATVMELVLDDEGKWRNKLGEEVAVEAEYVYPLLKSTDLFNGAVNPIKRAVIVPQKSLGENTSQLERFAPQLWAYLNKYDEVFARRKSSIYRNQPRFSIFGIGDYSFAPYKVAISGLHKTPKFRAVGASNERPVMLDDTSYFIPCDSPEQAVILTALLNSSICTEFLSCVMFADAKRPVTKKLLQRIDLQSAFKEIDKEKLRSEAETLLDTVRGKPYRLSVPSFEVFFDSKGKDNQQTLFQLA